MIATNSEGNHQRGTKIMCIPTASSEKFVVSGETTQSQMEGGRPEQMDHPRMQMLSLPGRCLFYMRREVNATRALQVPHYSMVIRLRS